MFNEFLTGKQYFDFLVERWEKSDESFFDVEIRDIIKLANQIDDLVTVWSCASHPEKGGTDDQEGHLICAVRTEAAAITYQRIFFDFFQQIKESFPPQYWVRINYQIVFLTRQDRISNNRIRQSTPVSPHHSIDFSTTKETKEKILSLFEKSVKEHV